MTAIGIIILFIYFLTLLWILIGNYRLKHFNPKPTENTIAFSIVIPFRNEAANLPSLGESLLKLDYPEAFFEILLVDDDSSDDSVAIIRQCLADSELNWRIIKNKRRSKAPKKDAITEAVRQSEHNWIITTDADCILPQSWLSTFSEFINMHESHLVAGPVVLNSSWESGFQSMENLSLQGVTIGGFGWGQPLLCNGANLAFRKDSFISIGGYKDNEEIASGDDVFLLRSMKRAHPEKVHFLKSQNAVVTTAAVSGIAQIISQRIRWARKTARIGNSWLSLIGLIVFVTNLWLVAVAIHAVIDPDTAIIAVGAFFIKLALDAIYLQEVNRFYERRLHPLLIIWNGLLYPFATMIIVAMSALSGYRWKGRYHHR